MTGRKKKGIGYFISGAVFIGVGSAFMFFDATPEWVSTAMAIVGLVANFLGFTTVFPDTDA